MAAVEQHPQNQTISTDCPCNTEVVTEARSLAQLCLPAPNRLLMKTCLEEQEDQGKNINFSGQSLDQVEVENYQLALFGPKEPPDKHPHMSFVICSDSAIFPKQENSSKDRNNGILTQLSATQSTTIKINSIFILKLCFNSKMPFL